MLILSNKKMKGKVYYKSRASSLTVKLWRSYVIPVLCFECVFGHSVILSRFKSVTLSCFLGVMAIYCYVIMVLASQYNVVMFSRFCLVTLSPCHWMVSKLYALRVASSFLVGNRTSLNGNSSRSYFSLLCWEQ